MSLGRWLLTHSLSLFLVAMLLAAWFWRDELELDRAWTQLRQVGSEMEQRRQPAREPAAQPEEISTEPAGERPNAPDRESATGADYEQAAEPDTSAQASVAAPEAAVGQVPEAAEQNTPAPSGQQVLMQARKAFWARDFDRAIALYHQLIESEPDNPDYLGELGNIYYNLNRFDRAAELFLKAGTRLARQGDLARARQLLPALQSLDREFGEQLEQAIRSGTRPAPETQS